MTKRKAKSMTKVESAHSKRSIRSDHLHISLSPSTFSKINSISSKSSSISTSKSKPGSKSKSRSKTIGTNLKTTKKPMPVFSSMVPKNAAVHFTHFYNDEKNSSTKANDKQSFPVTHKSSIRDAPRTAFTRQMVQKLLQSAGTEHYSREVSALLEEIVEPPGFNVTLSDPNENCAPYININPSYPLWYKDPQKMPNRVTKQYQNMKQKYQNLLSKTLGKYGNTETSSDAEGEDEEDAKTKTAKSCKEKCNMSHVLRSRKSEMSGFSRKLTLNRKSVKLVKRPSSEKITKAVRNDETSEYDSEDESQDESVSEDEDEDEESTSDWETTDEDESTKNEMAEQKYHTPFVYCLSAQSQR